jgi:predicted GIY-YIG superfamily endonuclease
MQPFYLYIFKCANGAFYIGHTDDIDRRLDQHMTKNPELDSYVFRHLPCELVFAECFDSRAEAFEAERRIKKWTRRKKESLIKKDWEGLCILAKKKFFKG